MTDFTITEVHKNEKEVYFRAVSGSNVITAFLTLPFGLGLIPGDKIKSHGDIQKIRVFELGDNSFFISGDYEKNIKDFLENNRKNKNIINAARSVTNKKTLEPDTLLNRDMEILHKLQKDKISDFKRNSVLKQI